MVSRSRCSSLLTRRHNATRSDEPRLASFFVIYPPSPSGSPSRRSPFRGLRPRTQPWFQRGRLEVQDLRLRRVSGHGPAEPIRAVHLDIQDDVGAVAVRLRISVVDDVADDSLVHPGLPDLLTREIAVGVAGHGVGHVEVRRPAPFLHVLMRQLSILRDRVLFQVPRYVPVTLLDSADLL